MHDATETHMHLKYIYIIISSLQKYAYVFSALMSLTFLLVVVLDIILK